MLAHGQGDFLRPESRAKRFSEKGVVVALWSRPDEPAALKPPQAKGIFIEGSIGPERQKAIERELNGLSAKRKSLRGQRKNNATRKGSRCQYARLLFFVFFPEARRK